MVEVSRTNGGEPCVEKVDKEDGGGIEGSETDSDSGGERDEDCEADRRRCE